MAALPWRWLPCSSKVFGAPKGIHATTAEYLKSANSDTRDCSHQIAPAMEISYPIPESVDAKIHWKFEADRVQEIPLQYVHELHDTRYWGDYAGTVIGRDDRILGDLTTDVWEVRRHRIFGKVKLPPCRRLAGTTALLSVAECEHNYWHWTMELLPRFHALERANIPWNSIDYFVINHRDHRFQRETLMDLGIPEEKILKADSSLHIECERALIPSLKPGQMAITPSDARFVASRATRLFPEAKPHRRLYLSRADAAFRRLTNENEVIDLLVPLGFEVVRCAELSILEQRRLFREALVVVGPHGSAFTNLVYCQPQTEAFEVMSPDYVDGTMWAIASTVGLRRHWVLLGEGHHPSKGVDPAARQQDITVDLDKLRATLRCMGL